MKKKKNNDNLIIANKKVFHDYFIEEKFEAGIALLGWEVKALRAGRVQLKESYIISKNRELFLFGSLITPLPSASTHIIPEPSRTRKLLLHRKEINKLIGSAERTGYSIAALNLFWKNNFVKAEIALVKGKKEFDKRETEKKRDWDLEKSRIMKHKNLNS